MSFVGRIKITLGLVWESLKLLLTHPWLMLYSVVWLGIIQFFFWRIDFNNPSLKPSVLPRIVESILFEAIWVLGLLFLVYLISLILKNEKFDVKELLTKQIVISFLVFLAIGYLYTWLKVRFDVYFFMNYGIDNLNYRFIYHLIKSVFAFLFSIVRFIFIIAIFKRIMPQDACKEFYNMIRTNFIELIAGLILIGIVESIVISIIKLALRAATHNVNILIRGGALVGAAVSTLGVIFKCRFSHWYTEKSRWF